MKLKSFDDCGYILSKLSKCFKNVARNVLGYKDNKISNIQNIEKLYDII